MDSTYSGDVWTRRIQLNKTKSPNPVIAISRPVANATHRASVANARKRSAKQKLAPPRSRRKRGSENKAMNLRINFSCR